MSDVRFDRRTVLKTTAAGVAGLVAGIGGAAAASAAGGGAHALGGFPSRAEFSFTTSQVQCKVKRVFAPAGTPLPGPLGEVPFDLHFRMQMFSDGVESASVDGNEVTLNEGVTGSMYSKTGSPRTGTKVPTSCWRRTSPSR